VGVDSTVLDGDYQLKNGTSMSTPHVSGAAALLWSKNPGCDAIGIRRALAISAEDLGAPGKDHEYGYGLVQVKDAHNLIASQGCDLPPPDDTTPLGPVAELSADVVSGSAPLTVVFDSSDSSDDGGIVSRIWNFGVDGSVEGDAVESYTYEEEGTYTASVAVVDADGLSDTASVQIQVGEPNQDPQAGFSFNPATEITTGTVVRFNGTLSEDEDSDELDYEWDFDDGKFSTKDKPLHRFSEPGNYNVRLAVSDGSGGADSVRQLVSVAEAPPYEWGDIKLWILIKNGGKTARLRWTGAFTEHTRIVRNGVIIKRTRNDGLWFDHNYTSGDQYRVCNVGTKGCSSLVTP